MKTMRGGGLVLAVAVIAGAVLLGQGQSSGPAAKGAPNASTAPDANTAPDAETLAVAVVNSVPRVDRENLKGYWTDVETRTKQRWIQILPALAKPPQSVSGTVTIVCWVHTDGRVTDLTLETKSGKAQLDRAALAAITSSMPFNAYPYGISVEQVKVRFTFAYNGGATNTQGPIGKRDHPI